MDGHWAAQKLTLAGLLYWIDWVVNDRWRRRCWGLRGVPVGLGNIQAWLECGLKLPVPCCLLKVVQRLLVAKTKQPLTVRNWAQRFGMIKPRTFITT